MSKKLVSPDTISGNTVCLIQKADSIYQPKSKSKMRSELPKEYEMKAGFAELKNSISESTIRV